MGGVVGGAVGCVFPAVTHATGVACGLAPDHTGTGREVPRQPVGVIAAFGGLVSAACSAWTALGVAGLGFGTAALPAGIAVGCVSASVVSDCDERHVGAQALTEERWWT